MNISHIPSFYRHMTPEPAARPTLAATLHADCVVVGGGLAGLTTAQLLAGAGRRVVLLEAGRVGWAASGRNGGFVSPGYAEGTAAIEARVGKADARRLWDLSADGSRHVEATLTALGRTDLIAGRGALSVWRYADPEGVAAYAQRMARDYDDPLEPLGTAEIRDILRSDRYFAAVRRPTGIQINPLAYAEVLAGHIEQQGGQIFEQSPALSLARTGTDWQVTTPSGAVTAADVVLCGNVGMGRLAPPLARAILPVATYVVVTERLGPRIHELIRHAGAVSDTRRAGDYYRIVDGDRLLWGGKITTRRSVPPRLEDIMRSTIMGVYPSLGAPKIAWSWIGHMGYARHKMPLVRELARGLYANAAFGGHGLNTTAAGAIAVSERILGTSDRIELFRPYAAGWGGGIVGRLATQAVYWQLQARDWWEERRATVSASPRL